MVPARQDGEHGTAGRIGEPRRAPRIRRAAAWLGLIAVWSAAGRGWAADAPTLGAVAAPLSVGAPITLTGTGITPGSVLKVFVATAGGPADVSGAAGLVPSSTTPTSFSVTLPFPWPVADPDLQFTVGNGFVSLQLVRTDVGYDATNLVGAVLLGNDALGVPSVTGIDGTPLSATSTDPSIGLANVETIVAPGGTMTIEGRAFQSSKVNIFTASGNVGPLDPASQTSTSISVGIPADAPVGPGSVQVVNALGAFRSSNAVSVPIGALVTVAGVEVNGALVTVHGTGFSSLTVINLFAGVAGQVVNLGGFDPGGSPNIPLTIVSDTELTFALPAGLDTGSAYVQVINPPFIPYTTSQGAGGSFTVGAPCGNGVIDPGELCDGDCGICDPEADPCFTTTGSAATCDLACHVPVQECGGGDGCCPFVAAGGGACGSASDAECAGAAWSYVLWPTRIQVASGCTSIQVYGVVAGGRYELTTCAPPGVDAGTGDPIITAVTDDVGTVYDVGNDDCIDDGAIPQLAGWSCLNAANELAMPCAAASPGGLGAAPGATRLTVQVCGFGGGAVSAPFAVWFNAAGGPPNPG